MVLDSGVKRDMSKTIDGILMVVSNLQSVGRVPSPVSNIGMDWWKAK